MRSIGRTLAICASIVLIVAACGSGEEDALVVYSGRSEDLVGPLIEAFEEENNLAVEVRYADSTELASSLLAEGDTTEADVFFAQDPASLGAVEEVLAELPDAVVDRVPEEFSDDDHRWVGTSGRARVLVYDTEAVAPDELPSGLADIVDPAWSGRLGVAPTNGSFLAFVAAMVVTEGEAETLAWLEALAANDPVSYPGNSPTVQGADAGEVDAGLVNHYYLLRSRAEGAGSGLENHFMRSGDAASLVMPAGAGVTAASDNTDDAVAFVEFLLSEESQRYFATETFEYPLASGVEPSSDLPPLDELNPPGLDLGDLAGALDTATDLVAQAGLI